MSVNSGSSVQMKPGRLYYADLKRSADAIRCAPGLLVVSLLLIGASEAPLKVTSAGVAGLVWLAAVTIDTGFIGTQRVWFLRILRGGQVLRPREIVFLTRSFLGRFIVLGLLCSIPILGVVIFIAVAVPSSHGRAGHIPVGVTIASLGYALLLDAAATFVVPALALSTRSVRVAIREGLRMIGAGWPASAWYVCAPGLTLTVFSAAFNKNVIGAWPSLALAVVGGAVALWFKGAIVSYYLRVAPVPSEDGSAYL